MLICILEATEINPAALLTAFFKHKNPEKYFFYCFLIHSSPVFLLPVLNVRMGYRIYVEM